MCSEVLKPFIAQEPQGRNLEGLASGSPAHSGRTATAAVGLGFGSLTASRQSGTAAALPEEAGQGKGYSSGVSAPSASRLIASRMALDGWFHTLASTCGEKSGVAMAEF